MARSFYNRAADRQTSFVSDTNVCLTGFYPVLPRLLPTNDVTLSNKKWQ